MCTACFFDYQGQLRSQEATPPRARRRLGLRDCVWACRRAVVQPLLSPGAGCSKSSTSVLKLLTKQKLMMTHTVPLCPIGGGRELLLSRMTGVLRRNIAVSRPRHNTE